MKGQIASFYKLLQSLSIHCLSYNQTLKIESPAAAAATLFPPPKKPLMLSGSRRVSFCHSSCNDFIVVFSPFVDFFIKLYFIAAYGFYCLLLY